MWIGPRTLPRFGCLCVLVIYYQARECLVQIPNLGLSFLFVWDTLCPLVGTANHLLILLSFIEPSVYIIFLRSNFPLNVVHENIYLDGDGSRTISASYYQYGTKTWSITAPEHTHIEMTFQEIDLTNCYDCLCQSVEVRDGLRSDSKLIGRYCGHTTPATVKSTGKYLWVKFNPNYNTGSFKATCRVKPGIHKLDSFYTLL